MNNRWLSTKETYVYLGASHDTVLCWIAKDMPAVKTGKYWKSRQLLVDEWIIANAVEYTQASKG